MDRLQLEATIQEQHRELQALLKRSTCSRAEEELIDLESHLAQVVIGVRRSGKSTLCLNVLKKFGKDFAYVNFDDERLANIKGSELNEVLEVLYKVYGDFQYLFIDEIQNIPEWFLFANRLLRIGMHLVVTGSNAKLLSGELATHLTGRFIPIHLYPFSFAEFCQWEGVDTQTLTTFDIAQRRAAFDKYMKVGGLPETFKLRNPQAYIDTLVNNVLERDIKQRYKLRYAAAFSQIANHILNIAPAKITISALQQAFKISSAHTVENYLQYLKQAYLTVGLHRYTTKSSLRMREEKLYAIDVALMNNRADAMAGNNLGWRLETIVFLELCRRYKPNYDIYYYTHPETKYEADFVVCKGNKTLKLIQVAYDISNSETRTRELRGLQYASKATKCQNLLLLTNHHREDTQLPNGLHVSIRPVHEWSLAEEVLE